MEKKELQAAIKTEIKNIDNQISMKEKMYTIGFTLILAIIYERFFTGKQWGVSIPIFYIMFMAFFLWSAREKVIFKRTVGFIMILPTLLIALNYSIHSNSVLSFFNGIMIVVLTCVSTVLIRYENIKWDSINLIKMVFKRGIKSIPENIDKFAFVIPSLIARSDNDIFLFAIITSRFTTIAIFDLLVFLWSA